MEVKRILEVQGHGKIVQKMVKGFFGTITWKEVENLSTPVRELQQRQAQLQAELKAVSATLKDAQSREKHMADLITQGYHVWLNSKEGMKYSKRTKFINTTPTFVDNTQPVKEDKPKDVGPVVRLQPKLSSNQGKQNNQQNQNQKGKGNQNNQNNRNN
jgi:hypothetical protein